MKQEVYSQKKKKKNSSYKQLREETQYGYAYIVLHRDKFGTDIL